MLGHLKKKQMLHFRVTLILVVCVVLYIAGAAAQESDTLGEKGTVHGYIIDTTPAQLPIVGVRVQKHGISKEQKSFFEKYGRTILGTLFSTIMAGIFGWAFQAFTRYLNRHQRSLNERRRNLHKRQRQQYLNER